MNAASVIADACIGSKEENRAMVLELEAKMRHYEPLEIKVTHCKNGQLYAREIFIPKDTF